jgi:GntR family transcriptional regulator
MRGTSVNGAPIAAAEWTPAPRPGSRYSTLARTLIADIEAGRYRVGEKIPTEAELQKRFGASRHTIREALRELKNQGMLVAHPGIGTVVRSRSAGARFGYGVSSLQELIQFTHATRMRVMSRREIVADRELAARFGCKTGQHWHEASVLCFAPRETLPLGRMSIYVREEHKDVIDGISRSEVPIFKMLERDHGVRLVEVRQEIVAVTLDAATGRSLKAPAGTPALQITRLYFDPGEQVVMVSFGQYPSDRFSHTTNFRVQREAGSRASGE